MFLFWDAYTNVVTHKDASEKKESANSAIIHHRKYFNADVIVLCKLFELIFGPMGCTPKFHSLHHMIRQLIRLKGHPTFEMIV